MLENGGECALKKKIQAAVLLGLVMLASISILRVEPTVNVATKPLVVAIDAGHGGYDPGKVGVSGVLEKDINLAIACKVRQRLEHEGVTVVMTRNGDVDLCGESAGSKKSADMRKRVEIINASGAALAVSIHQNSFTDSVSHGSQVFYYGSSKEGERLASVIQDSLREVLQDNNTRQPKANESYYLLKKVAVPIVIVECGFLSNPSEELLLAEEDYQDKVAEGIVKGILSY